MEQSLENKSILLIVSGGIAAYKSLELVRLIRKAGGSVRAVLTKGGAQFVTPLSLAALTEQEVYTDLWSLKDEAEMAHIRLSREADVIIVAPASADFIAKMANGLADDLATTLLLAANKQILIAPAMNHMMWKHLATKDNITRLLQRGVQMIGPFEGDMACGEYGMGRMAEPSQIFDGIAGFFFERPLKGLKALVTSGPTFEAIDPVRFIGNHSSGKQGHAIAQALRDQGAEVILVSGPTALPDPAGIKNIPVESAQQMFDACAGSLPVDIAVCAAAVSDWAPTKIQSHKIKKRKNENAPLIALQENPDILATLSSHKNRPRLVVGFAAETENLLENAREKLARKKCDWILANDVRDKQIFGTDFNHVHLVCSDKIDDWGDRSKTETAQKLAAAIAAFFAPYKL